MDELVYEMHMALEQGDWSTVVTMGSRLYREVSVSGDRVFAEGVRDVVDAALFVLEHPSFEQAFLSRAMGLRGRLASY